MKDLVDNYYSYYDEVKFRDPELGLIFFHTRPNEENEVHWFTSLYREVLAGNAISLVAEEGGKVVGMCDVHRLRPGSEISHTGVLGIAIREGYRDRGIGKNLMSATLEACRGHFEIIVLAVFAGNERALSMYKKLGFVEHGRLENAVRRGDRYFDEIHMHLQL